MALTLGGGPSQLSKGKFLLKGCVGRSGSPVMWDRECEVWGQKCDHLCSGLTRGRLFLDSRDSPTRLARLRRGRYARGDGVGPAPSPGPPTNGIRCLARCIPQAKGESSAGSEEAGGESVWDDSGPAAPRAFYCPRGPVPRGPSALTCAARRRRPQQQQKQEQRRGQQRGAGARSFPAGVYVHASGARGPGSGGALDARGPGTRPGWRTQKGARQLQGVIGSSAPARSPPRRWLSWKGRRARSPTARGSTMARDGRDPLTGCSRAPCPPPSSPSASSPLPPRDPLPVGAQLE